MNVPSRLTAASGGTACLEHLRRTVAPPLLGLCTRSYQASAAAAAQPQFDYDRYYYNTSEYDSGGGGRISPPAVDTEGSSTVRGVQWVFIGSPNAKKHVYAEMISKLVDVPHISITSLLRQDLSPHSPIYKQIAAAVNRGKIVPESIIFGLLSKRLEDGHCRGESGFILDGIPRTRLQAEILDQLVDVDLVVNFKCCEDSFQAGRSASDSSLSSDGTKPILSSAERTSEDSEPNITTFHREQMKLLEEYYQSRNKLIEFRVGNAPRETWKGLIAALHLQHIDAVHSSRMVTMGFQKSLRF
uniref:adenylate kinase n=1 Tax=Opuntia streptacantha TaxID=393608 RepID=A0A7C8YFK6_OPUST